MVWKWYCGEYSVTNLDTCDDVDYVSGGELFTHLYQRDFFSEKDVQIYIAEVVVALEKLHSVRLIINGTLFN